jgi:DNA-binding response OmpR family regulator
LVVKIGEIVVHRGVATRDQVEQAAREGRAKGERLCSRLLAMGVPEGKLAAVLAERHGVPGVNLSETVIPLEVLDLVPRAVAESDLILAVSSEGGRLHLAMAAPGDDRIAAEVRFVTGREVSPYVAIGRALREAIAAAYDARARGQKLWRGAAATGTTPHVAVRVGAEEVLEVEAMEAIEEVAEARPLAAADVEEVVHRAATDPSALADEPLGAPEVEIAIAGVDEEPSRPAVTVRADGRRTVLVVDDEPEIRQLVQRTLQAKGFAVETAADGAEGLAKAEAIVPDLVLLDAMLPKLHGFEACRRIKSGAKTREVPVVMMTAIYRGWRFAQDARESYGAEDYIEKPFRLDDLLRRVEAVLESTASRNKAPSAGAGEPHLQRGKELLLAGRVADAIGALELAIQADPYAADAHYQLARALRAQGEHFRAMTCFERATELRPKHLPSLRALAALYEETGFRRKAAETLERALGAAPDDATRGAIKQDLLGLIG